MNSNPTILFNITYLSSISFFVAIKLPALIWKKYIPLARFFALKVTVYCPGDCTVFTNVFTSLPRISNTFNVTFEVLTILYLIFVVGLKGFGKFCSNSYWDGKAEDVSVTPVGLS